MLNHELLRMTFLCNNYLEGRANKESRVRETWSSITSITPSRTGFARSGGLFGTRRFSRKNWSLRFIFGENEDYFLSGAGHFLNVSYGKSGLEPALGPD